MKFKKLIENFEDIFSWDKKELENNSDEIEELMDKLFDKRNSLEKKLRKEKDKDEKHDLEKKLKAVKHLIKKAKKSLII
ncbi:hypothetical protein ACMC56_09490 [Campylobacterota bacterium DY0563]